MTSAPPFARTPTDCSFGVFGVGGLASSALFEFARAQEQNLSLPLGLEITTPRIPIMPRPSKSPLQYMKIGAIDLGLLHGSGSGTANPAATSYDVFWATDTASTNAQATTARASAMFDPKADDDLFKVFALQSALQQIIASNKLIEGISILLQDVLGEFMQKKCLPLKISATVDSSVVFEFVVGKNAGVLDAFPDGSVVVLTDIDGIKSVTEFPADKISKAISLLTNGGF